MKKILIVGATSAIAMGFARVMASEHSAFFLVGRDAGKLAACAADLVARGATTAITYEMDAVEVDHHAPMTQACLAALGELDIALIAHGTLPNQHVCEVDAKVALAEFSTNGTSVLALLTALASEFERQRHGSIAVISSVAGDRGRPTNYLYGAAKAAVSAFCDGLRARMFKVGVHVLTIKPGFVDTPMTQGLALPQALVVGPDRVGSDIANAIRTKKSVLYTPGIWMVIMWVIRSIPHAVFKRIHL